MNKKTAITIIVMLSFLVICAVVYCVLEKTNSDDNFDAMDNGLQINESEEIYASDSVKDYENNDTFLPELCVYVCGAVINPGVYRLKVGKRLIDAVELAGGLSDGASNSYQNLAVLLQDGMQYYFPTEVELRELGIENIILEEKEKKNDFPININQASKEELTKIPGIGESKAEKIVLYRESFGKFDSVDDLVKVSGIGENMLFQIRAYVCV